MLHAMDQFIVSVSSLLLILISSAFFFQWFNPVKPNSQSIIHLVSLILFSIAASIWVLLKAIDLHGFSIDLSILFLMVSLYYGGYQVGLITLVSLQVCQGLFVYQSTGIWHAMSYVLTYGVVFYVIILLKKRMITQSISFFVLLAASLLISLPLIYFIESTSHMKETNTLQFILFHFGSGILIHASLETIRAQYARYHQACQEAGIDGLTGLYNRRKLEGSVRHLLKTETPFSILMLDVDHFKHINDIYGHDQGDAILHQISELLRTHCPDSVIVGRYGGEEFIMICPNLQLSRSYDLAEVVRAASAIYNYQIKDEHPVQITVSIGVAYHESFDSKKESLQDIVQDADRALYEAKRRGRNRVWYHPMIQIEKNEG